MSQAPMSEMVTRSTQKVNFSDDNRALHLQALFEWLPNVLHDAPGCDWTQIPSRTISYLVNTVGNSPWAAPLALAACVGKGAMKGSILQRCIGRLNGLLCDVQHRYGIEQVTGLTKDVWESYVTGKELTPREYEFFKTYAAFTEGHLPDHLEELTERERARSVPYVLPRLPRGFQKRYVPIATLIEGGKQRRKSKSDVLVPLHSLLVALVRFRKQSTDRLLSAYREAREQAKILRIELPLPFSCEEELVTVNRDAQTVADIRLEKRPVILRFLLWDRRSWVLKHPDDYEYSTRRKAELGLEEFAEPQCFVQCLNPVEELFWFGDLIKYRLLQKNMPLNITSEDAELRQQILLQFGTTHGLSCKRDGMLTPAQDFTHMLSHAIARTGALVFDVETLCRGALFASALATIALTNGSRMCELLQVSADRFKAHPYVIKPDGHLTSEERVMHLQLLLPKGKHTEAERKLFSISEWSWELLCEIAQELRNEHENRIPVVLPHQQNTKQEDLSAERYLFQWDASHDGKFGAFCPEDVQNLLRFILYGLEFRTKEGEPFSVSVHLLRHVMAQASRESHEVPMEVMARVLHHEQRDSSIPTSTWYYSEASDEQSMAVFAKFQTDLEMWAASLLVELPNAQEIADMEEDLRESFERWHTLLETAFGFCGNPDLCPRGYNRTLCIGCPHLVVDPRKRQHAVHWRNVYAQLASELEAKGSTVDARQYRLLVADLERHIKEMDLLQASIEDGKRKPIFLLLPSAPYREVIVDAQT